MGTTFRFTIVIGMVIGLSMISTTTASFDAPDSIHYTEENIKGNAYRYEVRKLSLNYSSDVYEIHNDTLQGLSEGSVFTVDILHNFNGRSFDEGYTMSPDHSEFNSYFSVLHNGNPYEIPSLVYAGIWFNMTVTTIDYTTTVNIDFMEPTHLYYENGSRDSFPSFLESEVDFEIEYTENEYTRHFDWGEETRNSKTGLLVSASVSTNLWQIEVRMLDYEILDTYNNDNFRLPLSFSFILGIIAVPMIIRTTNLNSVRD